MKHALLIEVEAETAALAMDCLASIIESSINQLQVYDLDAVAKGDEASRAYFRKCIEHRRAMQESIREYYALPIED